MKTQKKFPLLEAKLSYYSTIYEKIGVEVSVQEFLAQISLPTHKKTIDKIRSETDEAKQKKLKEKLPAATIAGTFTTKTNDGICQFSGLIAMDFDHLNERLAEALNRLRSDLHTFAVWRSVRGNGLCVLVKIMSERWEDSFLGLEHYYADKYGIIADPSCKNVNRLRFISYDPDLTINEDSALFKQFIKPIEREKRKKPTNTHIHTEDNIEHIVKQVEERGLDLCPTYDEWMRLGFALIAQYAHNGRDYYHRLSCFSPDYDPDECDKMFDYLLRYGSRQITIGTFYHFAKEAGIEIMTPLTKLIVSHARNSKRHGTMLDSVVDVLATMEGIAPDISRPIVEQVYAAKSDVDTDETIYEQTASLIKQQGLRFNEVSRRLMDRQGNVIEDRSLNNIYVDCLNLFHGKVKRSDFDTLIQSDVVPTFNPTREYFTKYRDRKPTGAIEALANTIETDTGFADAGEFDPTYAVYFLRKWLIGLVANIHGHRDVCSIMPVLTGKQGTGKTEWFRGLLPDELRPYYAETKFDAGKDDEILMTQKIILMNDELEGLTLQDARKLKALTSKQWFDLREPYGRYNVTLRRLAVLCGTSNPREVISDPTGNRRVIPINVLGIDHTAYNAIDKTDVLLEAYRAFEAGEKHTFNAEDVQRLKDSTNTFQSHSIERHLLMQHFAQPTSKGGERSEFMSAVQIMLWLELNANNRKLSEKKVSQELSSLGYESQQRRQNGTRIRGYEVVRLET